MFCHLHSITGCDNGLVICYMSQEIKVRKWELNRRSWQGSGTVPCSRLVSHWAHSCQVSFWPYDQQVIRSGDCFKASFNIVCYWNMCSEAWLQHLLRKQTLCVTPRKWQTSPLLIWEGQQLTPWPLDVSHLSRCDSVSTEPKRVPLRRLKELPTNWTYPASHHWYRGMEWFGHNLSLLPHSLSISPVLNHCRM